MKEDEKYLSQLIANSAESLNVELKNWLDLNKLADQAKLVKGCLAFRNNNGGYLLIGFSDDGKPSLDGRPDDIGKTYHPDTIQELVCKYASYPFQVSVHIVERDGTEYPVVSVGAGVRTPVSARSELSENRKPLIKDHAIYVRSLTSNYRASTSEAKRGDWDRLIEICMDNREADIARFVRRHLADADSSRIKDALLSIINLTSGDEDGPWLAQSNFHQDELDEIIARGSSAFQHAVKEKGLTLPEHGSFEAVIRIRGEMDKHSTSESFLNLIVASNPRYSGWPFWVDTRFFADHDSRPRVSEGGWQALLVFLMGEHLDKIDFWRAEPEGRFYHRRGLEDDILAPHHKRGAFKILDWVTVLRSVGEVIGTGLSLARGMGCPTQSTTVCFEFKWTRLKGRELYSWTKPGRDLLSIGSAYDETSKSSITVPLETADTAIFGYVHEATKKLFELFGGKELSKGLVEDVVAQMLNRER